MREYRCSLFQRDTMFGLSSTEYLTVIAVIVVIIMLLLLLCLTNDEEHDNMKHTMGTISVHSLV